jgi:hypothetical protein
VLDLQNGTNGRCRDSQRVLDELIEALERYKEAVGRVRGGWVQASVSSDKSGREGEMVKEREEGALGGVKRRCLQSSGGVGLAREG